MWEKWGLRDNPYSQNPIDERSLNLFVGREKELAVCNNGLLTSNSRIVIEGGRGVMHFMFTLYALRFTNNSSLITRNLLLI